ncbi:MAG: SGNH/GDSL hydrolase family protein [Armatimonadota bacterium]
MPATSRKQQTKAAPLRVRDGHTILFIGDSITNCGRNGPSESWGEGYVKIFADLLLCRRPTEHFTVLNKGVGMHTVIELQERWTDDVLDHHPDIVSVLIGINDAAHYATNSPRNITPERYAEVYDELLDRTRRVLPSSGILLLEPFYITRDTAPASIRNTMMHALTPFRMVVRDLARRYQTGFLPLHDLFMRLLRHHAPETFCPEPVHPYAAGHTVIAEALCRYLVDGKTRVTIPV